jgi:hypothetical protein
MQFQLIKAETSRVLFTVLLVVFLSACGGGGSGSGGGDGGGSSALSSDKLSTNAGIQQPAASRAQEDLIQGSTGNNSNTQPQDTKNSNTKSPDTKVDTGSFDLKWTAPVSRKDGSPLSLSDINGFKVYYGKSKGKYTHYIDVSNGTAQKVKVKDVPVGTYYVVMTTYDSDGRESGYSYSITKTVL